MRQNQQKLQNILFRVFLDSNVLQYIQKYSEEIFDNTKIPKKDENFKNIEALRHIFFVGKRGNLEIVLSKNSLEEVDKKNDWDYKQWAYEVLDYWLSRIDLYEKSGPFNGDGEELLDDLNNEQFDYLSEGDKKLLLDAIKLECHVFLTMDRKLWKNKSHIENNLNIKILQPFEYWNIIK